MEICDPKTACFVLAQHWKAKKNSFYSKYLLSIQTLKLKSFRSSQLHISKLATIATKDVLIRQVFSLDFEWIHSSRWTDFNFSKFTTSYIKTYNHCNKRCLYTSNAITGFWVNSLIHQTRTNKRHPQAFLTWLFNILPNHIVRCMQLQLWTVVEVVSIFIPSEFNVNVCSSLLHSNKYWIVYTLREHTHVTCGPIIGIG
jgi:hypothetical protein